MPWWGALVIPLMIKIAAGFEMTTDEPYLCTDWKETKFCSDPCKEEGTMLETRECVTTQPGLLLSDLEHPPVLIRAVSYTHLTLPTNREV